METPVDANAVRSLLDCSLPPEGRRNVSCIAAALREARQLVGREPRNGRELTDEHRATWSGALLYLIFAEQVGSCFSLVGTRAPRGGDAIAYALKTFTDTAGGRELKKLRNRLAHDFTLVAAGSPEHFVLHTEVGKQVVERHGEAIAVNLFGLALSVEKLGEAVVAAAERGELGCHHPGGIAAVERRFRMSVYA